jgi:hypothetical protein
MIVAAQRDFQIVWQVRGRLVFNGSADRAESRLNDGGRLVRGRNLLCPNGRSLC